MGRRDKWASLTAFNPPVASWVGSSGFCEKKAANSLEGQLISFVQQSLQQANFSTAPGLDFSRNSLPDSKRQHRRKLTLAQQITRGPGDE